MRTNFMVMMQTCHGEAGWNQPRNGAEHKIIKKYHCTHISN